MAARFFVNGGVDSNWGTSGNWSTTSGGAGGAGVPTNADDVTLDTNSPSCTLNASARVAKTLTTTAYTNTLTFTQKLTVSGSVTLGASMIFAGAAALEVDTTGTLTSNGVVVSVPLTFLGNSQTFTLADTWAVSALLTLGNGSGNAILNGNTINASAGLTKAAVSNISGTTAIVLNGTGTWSNTSGTGNLGLTLTINTAGTITVSGVVRYSGTLTYTAGTVVTTGSTLTITAASTLAIGGVTWANLAYAGAGATVTLLDAITLTGTFTGDASFSGVIWNGFSVTIGASLALINGIRLSGTTAFVMTGTGTIAMNSGGDGSIANAVTFNTSGTITLNGTITFSGVWTYTAGTLAGRLVISGSGSGGEKSSVFMGGFP